MTVTKGDQVKWAAHINASPSVWGVVEQNANARGLVQVQWHNAKRTWVHPRNLEVLACHAHARELVVQILIAGNLSASPSSVDRMVLVLAERLSTFIPEPIQHRGLTVGPAPTRLISFVD